MLSAVKWGSLVGIGLLLFTLALTFGSRAAFGAQPADVNHPAILSSLCLGLVVILLALAAAGYQTGRETLRIGPGVVAALIAFVLYAAGNALSGALTSQGAASSTTAASNPVAQVIAQALAFLIVLGIAALMGWIGARPGAINARKRKAAERTATLE